MTENKNIKEKDIKNIDSGAILRVASGSEAPALAGSITATMKNYGYASLRCIGDGAIGRAVKGAAIASGYLKPIGINIKLTPYFFETNINGDPKTGIAIDIEPD